MYDMTQNFNVTKGHLPVVFSKVITCAETYQHFGERQGERGDSRKLFLFNSNLCLTRMKFNIN